LSGPLHLKTARTWRTGRGAALLMAGALATTPALLQAQVSLATVVDLAQRNSSAVKLAQADISKANAVLSQTKDVIIPTVAFSTGLPVFPEVGFTGTPPSIWTTTVESLIFGVPQKHYINAARFGVQAATVRLRDAREQVALDASTAYIELDTVNQELAVALQQEGFAKRLVAIEQERTEAGVDALSELLQARLAAAEIELKREHLEGRAGTLANTLSTLTGLPAGSITPDHGSIPEIPQVQAEEPVRTLAGIESARLQASSKQMAAKADKEINYLPQLTFGAQYNRNTTLLNDVNSFFAKPLPPNNFSSGIAIQVPILDMGHWAKSRESAADALRATVEAEQAQRQNDVLISELTGTIRELDTLAEIASLKQQIAGEQLKTVLTELEVGNGGGASPGAPAQLSPKTEQQARIDERQKFEDSLDAGLDLAKARLGLLRALGHMEDWLRELRAKP
jgi:outer membrane protein TolC